MKLEETPFCDPVFIFFEFAASNRVRGVRRSKIHFFEIFCILWVFQNFFLPFLSFFNSFPRFFSKKSSNQFKVYGDIFICLQAIRFNGVDELLRSCGKDFSHKIMVGDFNSDLIEPNAETRELLNFIDKHSLKIVELLTSLEWPLQLLIHT